MAKIRIKNVGKIIAWLMRGIGATLRWEVRDDAGVFDAGRKGWIQAINIKREISWTVTDNTFNFCNHCIRAMPVHPEC